MKAKAIVAVALGTMLAGCGGAGSSGGSGTGVVSTPTPISYPRIADIATSNYDFQASGVSYSANPATGFSGGTTFTYGSGAAITYNVGTDTFTLTAPGGTSQTFTAANLQAPSQGAVNFLKQSGAVQDSVTLTVPLTYAMVAIWNRLDAGTGARTGRILIGGSQTQGSDVPRSGSATYSVQSGGAAQAGGTTYNLTSSTATFSANFASSSVQTSVTLAGPPLAGGAVSNFGTFSGTGTISSSGPGFSGTLAGTSANGVFSGAFFGPQAAEVGYGYVMSGAAFSAAGVVVGTKQ